jgi:myo-inositol-1(or 4)-monophosphatase
VALPASEPASPAVAARAAGLARELEVALAAAHGAAAIQRDRYERLERIVHKSEKDVVTEVDTLCEDLIIGTVREAFPSDAFLAEESGRSDAAPAAGSGRSDAVASGAAAPARRSRARSGTIRRPRISRGRPVPLPPRTWVIDPLDGTVNYANGIPVFCVSIALVRDGRPVVGVVIDAMRDDRFTAVAGGGAFLGDAQIRHPRKQALSDLVASLALPPSRFGRREARIRKAIRVSRVMGSSALALAYVGNGRFDAFVQAAGLSLWDVAAAGLIAEEGGARVTDLLGGPWFDPMRPGRGFGLLAARDPHHAELLDLLR